MFESGVFEYECTYRVLVHYSFFQARTIWEMDVKILGTVIQLVMKSRNQIVCFVFHLAFKAFGFEHAKLILPLELLGS
jgi:hypothetical protein